MFLIREKRVAVVHQVAPLCIKQLMKMKLTDLFRTTCDNVCVPEIMQTDTVVLKVMQLFQTRGQSIAVVSLDFVSKNQVVDYR